MKKITKFTGYVSIMLTICLLLGATSVDCVPPYTYID